MKVVRSECKKKKFFYSYFIYQPFVVSYGFTISSSLLFGLSFVRLSQFNKLYYTFLVRWFCCWRHHVVIWNSFVAGFIVVNKWKLSKKAFCNNTLICLSPFNSSVLSSWDVLRFVGPLDVVHLVYPIEFVFEDTTRIVWIYVIDKYIMLIRKSQTYKYFSFINTMVLPRSWIIYIYIFIYIWTVILGVIGNYVLHMLCS